MIYGHLEKLKIWMFFEMPASFSESQHLYNFRNAHSQMYYHPTLQFSHTIIKHSTFTSKAPISLCPCYRGTETLQANCLKQVFQNIKLNTLVGMFETSVTTLTIDFQVLR